MSNEDDGLMLNFAAPAAAGAAKKQPQSAKQRQAASLAKKRSAPSSQPSAAGGSAASPQVKRQRVEQASPASAGTAEPRVTNLSTEAAVAQAVAAATTGRYGAPKPAAPTGKSASKSKTSAPAKPATGIISSLFTGSSTSSAASKPSAPSSALQRPTNAPLDTSSFAGLGLDALLVAHLAGRMSIGTRPTSIQRAALPALMQPNAAQGTQRDVLIHAQTGSGKTLAYLLPIMQSLLPLCTDAASWIDRSVGTLAIILAPTRELARQIYEVAEKLVSLHLSQRRAEGEEAAEPTGDEEEAPRRTRWLVPGLLSGGSTRNHEKSKLRKGIPIIVATPGRLLDHLQNTTSLDVGKLQWLVLDEADRLLEMGFRETLEGILKALEGRRRLSREAAKEAMRVIGQPEEAEAADAMGIEWWKHPRRTVLCSATLDENVQVLAGSALQKPIVVRGVPEDEEGKPAATDAVAAEPSSSADEEPSTSVAAAPRTNLSAPAQLRQHYVVAPTKQRLVVLLALLRRAVNESATDAAGARRIIVFISCTDSVDFLWRAMGGATMSDESTSTSAEAEEKKIAQTCELIPNTPIHRLHGSLTQSERIASLKAFSKGSSAAAGAAQQASILLCTSVAARGLDLPDVGCVIQLDAPTEGGVDEYLHRIGRTARVGRAGQSWLVLLPSEQKAAERMEKAMRKEGEGGEVRLREVDPRNVLRDGFGGRGDEYEARATEAQLAFERWVLRSEEASNLARKAYLSHIRAYATHPASEKDLFNVSLLQLGHLAKAFALREAPATIKALARAAGTSSKADKKRQKAEHDEEERRARKEKKLGIALGAPRISITTTGAGAGAGAAKGDESDDDDDLAETARRAAQKAAEKAAGKGANDAEARMYTKVREMGRLTRKGGKLAEHGADEFQLG